MKKFYSIIPKYSLIPLLIMLVFHMSTFFLTRLFTNGAYHYDFSLGIDRAIPFVPAFIIIYVLAYVQWAVGIYYMTARDREVCFRFIATVMIGEVICLITFIAFPTALSGEVTWPKITGEDPLSLMTKLIYSLDEPNNLFPSLHCFASWICFRGIFFYPKERRHKVYMAISFVFSLLVFASTVFVKQHVVVDIIGGVLLAEIAIMIEKLTNARRVFFALDRKLSKNDPEARKEP